MPNLIFNYPKQIQTDIQTWRPGWYNAIANFYFKSKTGNQIGNTIAHIVERERAMKIERERGITEPRLDLEARWR